MGRCAYCGQEIDHPFPCRHCEQSFCGDHRLPENHDCPLYISEESLGGSGPDTRPIRDDRATSKQRIYQKRTIRSQEKRESESESDIDSTSPEESGFDAFCEGCGKIYYPDGLCDDCRDADDEVEELNKKLQNDDQPDSSTYSAGAESTSEFDYPTEKQPGSEDPDFESSQDVASDGVIVHNDKTSGAESESETNSKGSFLFRLLGSSDGGSKTTSNWDEHGIDHRRKKYSSPSRLSLILTRLKVWFYRLVIVGIIASIAIFAVALTVGTGIPAVDDTASDVSAGVQNIVEEEPLDRSQIERDIHYFINQERQQRGLEPLTYDEGLQEVARYHSRDMIDQGYFAHDAPSGETLEDRYGQFGIRCAGGENIAYTYADQDVVTDTGDTVDHDNNESKIARGIVRQWMNSPGHRENILRPRFQREGIGIVLTEDDQGTKVMATQNFC